MDIAISGHQVELSEAFRAHATEGLEQISAQYFARAIGATVVLGRGPRGNGFTCEVVLHAMKGVLLKGASAAAVAQQAFDGACAKVAKQLRRHKRRLTDHHAGLNGHAPASLEARYTVFEPLPEPETDEALINGDAPVVIAERAVDIPTASVADAVVMLDLRNTAALMFKNARSGAFNMVYRREDGSIGWVEPERA
jgi:ribosomal subunit interface protein